MIMRLKIIFMRYKAFVILAMINALMLIFVPETGVQAIRITGRNTLEMLAIIPPIFILLGLLDVWVKRETMVKYMGEGSGKRGMLLGFMMGSVAAGPLYAAFPVAGLLLAKGAKFSNVLIMIGAWSTTKIPLLLFEASALGVEFMVIRLVLNLLGIALIAVFTEKVLSKKEIAGIYGMAQKQVS